MSSAVSIVGAKQGPQMQPIAHGTLMQVKFAYHSKLLEAKSGNSRLRVSKRRRPYEPDLTPFARR